MDISIICDTNYKVQKIVFIFTSKQNQMQKEIHQGYWDSFWPQQFLRIREQGPFSAQIGLHENMGDIGFWLILSYLLFAIFLARAADTRIHKFALIKCGSITNGLNFHFN